MKEKDEMRKNEKCEIGDFRELLVVNGSENQLEKGNSESNTMEKLE